MNYHLNVLIAENDISVARPVEKTLRSGGHACTVASGVGEAIEQARSGEFDVVVVSLQMPDGGGNEVMAAARSANPECQVILVTDSSSVSEAVAAMNKGAMTYIQKPLNLDELTAVVDRAVERVRLEKDRAALQREVAQYYGYMFESIIGTSPIMRQVFERIEQVAPTTATLLITGETGTGKELVARAIHYNSPRRNNRFVPLNCAGLAETILESELFGHEKGAFTGATSSRIGMFEYVSHGTLFLDEIGDMPMSSQVKLLRVLESGEIVRVGSNEPIHVDVRLVAATNQNLRQKVQDGIFREDLFYRLNVVTIHLPPLRERQGDIALLIEYYVRLLADTHHKNVAGLSTGARKILLRYQWPGNVRELKNCLEHMVVVSSDPVLGEDDLPDYLLEELGLLLKEPTLASIAGRPMAEVERDHIRRTLELVDGNRERAADLLGMGERTLYRKIEKYGLR